MPDPAVFGPEAADDGFRGQHTYRPAEAGDRARRAESDAMRRAYLGHGDQLGALEAEAYRDQAPLTVRRWLRLMLGPWGDP